MYYEKIWSFQLLDVTLRQKSKHHCVKSKHYGIMKRLYIITILAIICSMSAMAQNSPGMAHQNNGKDRWQIKGSFSRPSIQYDVINGEKILTVLNASGTCSLWINEYSTENIVFGPESVDGEYDEVNQLSRNRQIHGMPQNVNRQHLPLGAGYESSKNYRRIVHCPEQSQLDQRRHLGQLFRLLKNV